jgi:hypothetical protein
LHVVGLLAFYDEQPKHLATCVASLAKLGASHLVALDGAYALYPGGQAISPDPQQHLAIQYMAAECGMGLTLHTPAEVWQGNEVEKRQKLFDLGHAVAGEGDWLLVIDADEVVIEAPDDLHDRLAQTEHQVARITEVDLALVYQNDPEPEFPAVRLYRAQPITVKGNHYTHLNAKGEVICGHADEMTVGWLESGVRLEHRRGFRDAARQMAQGDYYTALTETAIERLRCGCGQPGKVQLPYDWRMTERGLAAELGDFCHLCAITQRKKNETDLRELGADPQAVRYTHRQGRAPAGVT